MHKHQQKAEAKEPYPHPTFPPSAACAEAGSTTTLLAKHTLCHLLFHSGPPQRALRTICPSKHGAQRAFTLQSHPTHARSRTDSAPRRIQRPLVAPPRPLLAFNFPGSAVRRHEINPLPPPPIWRDPPPFWRWRRPRRPADDSPPCWTNDDPPC
jgi:hypothetical protein